MRALLSVTDKTGLPEFASALIELGYELISTGGTAKALREAQLPVRDISEITDFPEMLDGRVKTLNPFVHGALLGDVRLETHVQQMKEFHIRPIELLVVNLYAFEKTVTSPHTWEEAIESIDIGGPAMIRAASKNHANVTVVVDPADYAEVLAALGSASIADLRPKLAAKAFRHTAYYDSMIARYLTEKTGGPKFPETYTVGFRLRQGFRYGENMHQAGALYTDPLGQPGICQCEQLWGEELSYNNLTDAQGAWELVSDMPEGSCAIIKHANPCGAAVASSLGEAYRLARATDPISAFGGIAAFNQKVGARAAEAMIEKGNFLHVIIAPSYDEDALELFRNRSGWGKTVRILKAPLVGKKTELTIKTLRGGAVIQESDEDPASKWIVKTAQQPTPEQMAAMRLMWTLVQHVKSNAIVVGTQSRLLGVGAGQMNRVQSVRLALEQAGEAASEAVLASDAFFPFPDSVQTAAAAGIKAIVQPGGSNKDEDVIQAANELGVAMVFTGVRHFQH